MGNFIWQDIEKRNLDLAKMAPGFAHPVLILHGRQDPLGESVPQELAKYYKNSKLIFIEKCGHYSWIEQPEKVFSAVRDFLAERGE
jgi:proline iminopeptidase